VCEGKKKSSSPTKGKMGHVSAGGKKQEDDYLVDRRRKLSSRGAVKKTRWTEEKFHGRRTSHNMPANWFTKMFPRILAK